MGASMTAWVSACGGSVTVDLGHDPDQFELIDDMEDNDKYLPERNGRNGGWATYNDGTPGAMQTPEANGFFAVTKISPPRGSSHYAARTYGCCFTNPAQPTQNGAGWALMTAVLVNPSTATDAAGALPVYDASAYRGVRFWARVAPASQPNMRFSVDDLQTDPRGGTCGPDINCYNRFGKVINLTTEWTLYKILFSELKQDFWGTRFPSIDIEHVFALSFNFAGPAAFDLWIDDLEFVVGPYSR